jgi:hypothetical protein
MASEDNPTHEFSVAQDHFGRRPWACPLSAAPSSRRTRWAIASLAATLAAFALSACGSQTGTSSSTVTVTQHSAFTEPSAASTSAAPKQVTIPEVNGQNAEIVRKNLEKLSLTDVSLASANPKYSVVVLASNWTAVSIEPPPGTVVSSDDPVVVKVTKP